MESGDGLLVRLPAGSRGFTAGELRALCRLADAHGNGLIEVTRRANLQLRGLREDSLPALRRALVELGLASGPESSATLLVNPLAGLASDCESLEPLARAIDAALVASGALVELSDKFGVVVDCCGELREIAADIRVERKLVRAELRVDGDDAALGSCASSDAPRAVAALASVLAANGQRRMRQLMQAGGRAELLRAARLDAEVSPPSAATPRQLGFQRGARDWLGLALAFGSGTSQQWRALADLAERFGSGELRTTPFRGVILPDVGEQAEVRELAAAAGWISAPSEPLLRVSACPGAPACSSAAGDTRDLARALAPLLAADARMHVSGCEKGCAHSGAADVTLVRVAGGVKLGFGLSAAQTAEQPDTNLETARVRVQAHS